MRRLILFVAILWGCLGFQTAFSHNEEPVDSTTVDSTLRVSLLTCSPGQASYELYGHTAIRVQSKKRYWDLAFNYGVFNFHQPHFIWRFVLGECDYMVMPYSFSTFFSEYEERGSSIVEQELNLLPWEAEELVHGLFELCQSEERIYRYNIFRSNCTTKARDLIEEYVQGEIIYPMRPRRNTFRSILHQFTAGHAWDEVGNDLLLGADVDTLLTERDEMFSPIYLMWYFDSAMVDRGYTRYDPLVRERRVLLEENAQRQQLAAKQETSFPIAPVVVGWGFLAICLLLGVWEMRRQRALWPVDMVLMTLQGVAGILLTFMSLCSQHPGVASNWQVWVLNPLPLFFIIPVIRAERKGQSSVYHCVAACVLLLFSAMYIWLPQDFSMITLPLALILLSRAVLPVLIEKKKNNNH